MRSQDPDTFYIRMVVPNGADRFLDEMQNVESGAGVAQDILNPVKEGGSVRSVARHGGHAGTGTFQPNESLSYGRRRIGSGWIGQPGSPVRNSGQAHQDDGQMILVGCGACTCRDFCCQVDTGLWTHPPKDADGQRRGIRKVCHGLVSIESRRAGMSVPGYIRMRAENIQVDAPFTHSGVNQPTFRSLSSIQFLPQDAMTTTTRTRIFGMICVFAIVLFPEPNEASAQNSASVKVQVEASREASDRPRARDLGIAPGILAPGPLNAITDVSGVRVGHVTMIRGDSVNTGATAILPHGGNLYQDRVPAGFFQGNGYGKFAGTTQILELGEMETPIILTNTLSVAQGMEAAIGWTLDQDGNEGVRSVNAVVGETNDGYLNDIRGRHLRAATIRHAIESARSGPVEEGSIGAGRGTVSFGWKGGIGTSSRQLPEQLGGFTVGVLVQTNYGGILRVDGVPVGEALGQYFMSNVVDRGDADGSVIVVIATDAPLSDRNLERLAARAMLALGRTGSPATNGSGDYAIAFSTAEDVRRGAGRQPSNGLDNGRMSPFFQAAVEATEEAILNALFRATTVDGHRGKIHAIDVEAVMEVMERHGYPTR